MRHAFYFIVILRKMLNAELAYTVSCSGRPISKPVFYPSYTKLVPIRRQQKDGRFSCLETCTRTSFRGAELAPPATPSRAARNCIPKQSIHLKSEGRVVFKVSNLLVTSYMSACYWIGFGLLLVYRCSGYKWVATPHTVFPERTPHQTVPYATWDYLMLGKLKNRL